MKTTRAVRVTRLVVAAIAYVTAAVFGIWLGVSQALSWDLAAMNRTIDQTNFVVGQGCSGTLIDAERRLIVTAFHCVRGHLDDAFAVSQSWHEGRDPVGGVQYVTHVVAHRSDRDLAILQLDGDVLVSTEAAELLPEGGEVLRGEAVWAIGNPAMQEATVTAGVVSSVTRRIEWGGAHDVPVIQFSADIAPGSSGGAVYNDKGQYIGTSVGGIDGTNLEIAISSDWLHALLAELEPAA